jgi:hypothetical protein
MLGKSCVKRTLGGGIEDGKIAVQVVDAGVVMIRHGSRECDLDICAHGGQREAIDEGVVGVVVGAQEEAAL